MVRLLDPFYTCTSNHHPPTHPKRIILAPRKFITVTHIAARRLVVGTGERLRIAELRLGSQLLMRDIRKTADDYI